MNQETLEKRINHSIKILLTLLIAVPSVYVIWFYGINHIPLTKSAETWGQFGDYIGGILNPLFSLFAVYWLVTSVKLQKTELEETRKALIGTKDSQEAQAETLFKTARLTAISALLSTVNSKSVSARENIRYLCSQLTSSAPVRLNGDVSNFRIIREDLALLENQVKELNQQEHLLRSAIFSIVNINSTEE